MYASAGFIETGDKDGEKLIAVLEIKNIADFTGTDIADLEEQSGVFYRALKRK